MVLFTVAKGKSHDFNCQKNLKRKRVFKMIGINTNLLTLTILILLIILQTKGFPMEKMVTFIKSNRLLHKRVERAKYKANWGESSLEIERQFNQYYKCLDKRVQQITQKGHHIKAVIAMFGQNLELKCHVW